MVVEAGIVVLFLYGKKEDYEIGLVVQLSLIHISEPTRRTPIPYAVFCLKKIETIR